MKPAFKEEFEKPLPLAAARPPVRIALAGYGVGGQALPLKLDGDGDFELGWVLGPDANRARVFEPPVALTTDLCAFLAVPAAIIIEVTSCDATGALISEHALSRGVHVVSASKRVVSACRTALVEPPGAGGSRLPPSAAGG